MTRLSKCVQRDIKQVISEISLSGQLIELVLTIKLKTNNRQYTTTQKDNHKTNKLALG